MKHFLGLLVLVFAGAALIGCGSGVPDDPGVTKAPPPKNPTITAKPGETKQHAFKRAVGAAPL